jgi:uncharacterized protein YggE
MSDTVITVRGRAREEHPAERAVVRVGVSHDGPHREAVVTAATTTADRVRAGLEPLQAAGAVSAWSSDRVAIWSDRPWNADGKQLPLVYHASVAFLATFVEFDELARWVEEVGLLDGVDVGSIAWELTDETREAVLERVRTRAVEDAQARALVYARAAGLQSVRAAAIADPGLLSAPEPGTPMPGAAPMARAFAAKDSSGPSLALTPADLEVTAEVEGRFTAG